MAVKILGIDVSRHNGNVDWVKVKNSGVKFVILRAGYGSSTVDSKFVDNIKGAIAANLDIGIYWFSYALNVENAKSEAKKCLATISAYKNKINYPVFYDFEYDSVNNANKNNVKVTKTLVSNMAKAFLEEIKAAGYIPGMYTNIDYSKNYFTSELLDSYDTWVAQYSTRSTYTGKYTMWQYSESGKVDGISGNVDMNYSFKDYGSNSSDSPSNDSENKAPVSKPSPLPDSTKASYITSLQSVLNSSYNAGLKINGLYDDLTKDVVKKHALKKDLSNAHIKWLQGVLNKVMSTKLAIDGSFGDKTLQALKDFQKKYNLTVDGYAGEQTHAKLISLL